MTSGKASILVAITVERKILLQFQPEGGPTTSAEFDPENARTIADTMIRCADIIEGISPRKPTP